MSTQTISLAQLMPTCPREAQRLVQCTSEFVSYMAGKGGPDPADYPILNTLLQQFSTGSLQGIFSDDQIQTIRNSFGDALSPETIQGWAYHKPLGYAGDFQIIEKIYTHHTSSNPHLAKWDTFFHSQPAPRAVRNRLSFFLDQVWKSKMESPSFCRVLNVASGPGRDMRETLKFMGPSGLQIDCVEQDGEAIKHSQNLCQRFLSNIQFHHQNAFRFSTDHSYNLIWSAGLFDYFNDHVFQRVLKKYFSFLKPKGRLVVGNFTDENPSRGYMELFQWNLFHRSAKHLNQLAKNCGFQDRQIRVEAEPEGINLFLTIEKV